MSTAFQNKTRQIALARALHARLYVSADGRVFAVSGPVVYDKLARALAHYDHRPTLAEAPTPRDLGIAACDGELSHPLLHCIGQALNRWQKALAAESRRRPARRRGAIHLTRDHQEIERLAGRLAAVRQWRASLAAGREPIGAPFFLDPIADDKLVNLLKDAERCGPLPALVAWQARVVWWLSGECATRRFLTVAADLVRTFPEVSSRECLRGFQRALVVWKQRSQHESIRNLLAEISEHIRRLPMEIAREGRLTARLRGRSFPEHCDALIGQCSELLIKNQRYRTHVLPAALAALAAADQSAIAIPRGCWLESAKLEDFAKLERTIQKLAEQIGRPGYDALLSAIDSLPESANKIEFGELRELLARGNSPAESVWACEHGLAGDLKVSCLSAAAARRLDDEFKKRGFGLEGNLSWLLRRLQSRSDLPPITAWLKWLSAVAPVRITPQMWAALHRAFWDLFLPCVQRLRGFEHLAPCLETPPRSKRSDDPAPLLAKVSELQRLAGKTAAMPKSLRKMLDYDQHRRREREYLEARLASGDLDAAARLRLQYLERDAASRLHSGKLRRAAEESFLLVSIEAMRIIGRRLAEANCRRYLGRLTASIDPDRLWAFSIWIGRMSEQQRHILETVIAYRARYGLDYKRRLPENKRWIANALCRGFDVQNWLAAETRLERIEGHTMEISVAGDVHEIFLMGDYFHTCLALGDCNAMSVLANAYDANKQVIFMFTESAGPRRPVARQIVAVSGGFELLRYECYISSRFNQCGQREKIRDAMARYCGRLAAQCGLLLSDEGSPEAIADHFWYDDGERQWSEAARGAWEQEQQALAARRLLVASGQSPDPMRVANTISVLTFEN